MTHPPLLILDFDGTVALGDGPVLAYARCAAEANGTAPRLVDEVAALLRERPASFADGYELVRRAARAHGVTEAELAEGYLASRALLGTPAALVRAPAGLRDFLGETSAERVLLTNAPETRIVETLDVLGLGDSFDRIVTDAGKPAGLSALLDGIPQSRRVLCAGDVWENDLAPAHLRGHATALVGLGAGAVSEHSIQGGADGEPGDAAVPTYRGETLAELIPDLRAWNLGANPLHTLPCIRS